MSSEKIWQVVQLDDSRPNIHTSADLHDEGDHLLFSVEYCFEGASISLDLNDVAKLREALDVWFDQHA